MPIPRALQVDLEVTTYYHCVSRCVRRAFLCGDDRYCGRNFDHRKQWVVERLRFLSEIFAVDVCAYAVMSNHFHLVVRVDQDRALAWSEREVVSRYGRLYSRSSQDKEMLSDKQRAEQTAVWRSRLADLSWMMRALNEWIARRANREDDCKGHFWEGRFKSQALLDEGALLTCMSYVDLNPVRAGLADNLEESDLTSIQERLRAIAKARKQHAQRAAPANLIPFSDQQRSASAEVLPLAFTEYVELLEWAGSRVRPGKGRLASQPPDVLERLGMNGAAWLTGMREFGRSYSYLVGSTDRLAGCHARLGRHWTKGVRVSQNLYRAAG